MDPPAKANLNTKVIFNTAWVNSCCNGSETDARQKATQVIDKAEALYSSSTNSLGTKITFRRVGGGKLVFVLKIYLNFTS